MVIADGFVGKSPLMEPGEVQLAIPYRDVLCLAAPQLILLQVGDGIAVAAPCALPQVRAQQHMALHQLPDGGGAPCG